MAQSLLLPLAVAASCIIACLAANDVYTAGTTKVELVGKSPNFLVYPNTSNPDVFLMMKFSKLEEREVGGGKVNIHSITSLASADPVFNAALVEVKKKGSNDKVNVTKITMTVDPASKQSFQISCDKTKGKPASETSSNITLSVIMYVGITEDVQFPYGVDDNNNTLYTDVAKGDMKFNVALNNWIFCTSTNYINLDIDLSVKGNVSVQPSVSGGNLTMDLGGGKATIQFADYALPTFNSSTSKKIAMKVPAITAGNGSAPTSIALQLPNPNGPSFYYDPSVTVTATAGNGGGGAASAARVSFWAAAAAVLLSMLMFF
ncbi:hypothetical protein CHLRE_03g152300v5 [Chlamydomonas reinhardtii]|uniref:Uncharacterized protein n=1 Tax=Chlamydomonas reinhardtii TaxID=3055 RepID=A0A2K3DVT3_CHLRE|nr:uncharacterized protein CHLRE_03g152300v5 [Chlamydomonas reinhardtii]PNW84634.1 hypothetical protein CHLRE_03g152300v5 [Chlamydomonas reinhardtii]